MATAKELTPYQEKIKSGWMKHELCWIINNIYYYIL